MPQHSCLSCKKLKLSDYSLLCAHGVVPNFLTFYSDINYFTDSSYKKKIDDFLNKHGEHCKQWTDKPWTPEDRNKVEEETEPVFKDEEIVRNMCREAKEYKSACCEYCNIANHDKCWQTPLLCPICNIPMVKANITIDGVEIDCAWTCLMIECRKGKLEAPIFYGYTQEAIDSNEV